MKGVSLPDLLIIVAYFAAMIGVGVYFARRRASIDQFTRASGKIPGWALGISLYATFLSSNTFLGVPGKAFGSNWNSFVFSLSMPFAAWVATRYFVPFYRHSGEISAYSHLERRFGPWARTYTMVCFLLTQLARMGAIFFGVALVLAPLIHVDIRIIMAVSGACIVIYTLLGGMEAVIWTEVVQGIIKTAGALLVLGLVMARLDGGVNDILTTGAADDKFSLGSFDITELGEPTFWVVLVYGFFINLTNFGIDQNYVQRYHTARTAREAARSIWLCVYCYVPVSLVFFFIGTALYTYYSQHPEAMASMKEAVAIQRGVPADTLGAADYGDQAMPRFMVTNVPRGLLGLILAALLSAAMSTISSGINSSATVILNDIYLRYINPSASEQQEVRVLQVATVLIALLALATGVAMIGTTSILDLWWALSGAFAGGMLGLFLLGMLSRSAGNIAARIGTTTGVLIIGWIMLSRWLPESLQAWRSPLHTHLAVMVGTLAIFLTGIMVTSVKAAANANPTITVMTIKQLTTGAYGHTLNATQVFSPDGAWIYYDTRNDDTHIGRTGAIEKVNLYTGEVVRIYTVPRQTEYGPGVGAVACDPVTGTLIFIHGLYNCNAEQPYGMTRRFGALYSETQPGIIRHAEARVLNEPLIPGALRGGTHAHTWSGDGSWISFTYNDRILEALEQDGAAGVKDLRTIGVLAPVRPVIIPQGDTPEEFSGSYFAALTATVTEQPAWGSDAIEKAFDECWIGQNGYRRVDGTRQQRAVAFQGNIRTDTGDAVTEVFVADLPDDITRTDPGTLTTRPDVPAGLKQRRVTDTTNRKHPGLQGPRYRLRTSPDGGEIYFLMRDDNGVVQLYGVPVHGGAIRQITYLPDSIQTQFNLSPDGNMLAFAAGNRVWIVPVREGAARAITDPNVEAPVNGVLWTPGGDALIYNQYTGEDTSRWLQIFVVALPDV